MECTVCGETAGILKVKRLKKIRVEIRRMKNSARMTIAVQWSSMSFSKRSMRSSSSIVRDDGVGD